MEVVGLHGDLGVCFRRQSTGSGRRCSSTSSRTSRALRSTISTGCRTWSSWAIPYTGCNPRGLLLARDKALAKKILAIRRRADAVVRGVSTGRGVARALEGVRYPAIVKSLIFDGSVGVSQASVVRSEEKLRERVAFIHEQVGTDAIVEEFIDGRELYVGIVGNRRLETFPVWELRFRKKPKSTLLMATERVKWSSKYQKQVGVKSGPARLADDKRAEVDALARHVYRSLEMSGYARIDFRMNAEGEVYFLEANPNPQLGYGEDFAESGRDTGFPTRS